jgi:hypothetical protein
MASGSKPILELPNRHAEDRRGTLSIEDSLSAIAGAEIASISRGGVLCNIARLRREEGDPIHPHSTPLEREPCVNQACSSGQMHSSLCDTDSMLREVKRGYLSYKFSMEAKLNTLWEMWPEKAWNALEAGGNLFPTTNPPFMSSNEIGVNVLTWNCRGVLNPCFRRALLDLLKINSPAILVLTETRLGGSRAQDLAKTFPFDGFLCTNTIGFAGGIWIMWNSDMVEVEHLCSTGTGRFSQSLAFISYLCEPS